MTTWLLLSAAVVGILVGWRLTMRRTLQVAILSKDVLSIAFVGLGLAVAVSTAVTDPPTFASMRRVAVGDTVRLADTVRIAVPPDTMRMAAVPDTVLVASAPDTIRVPSPPDTVVVEVAPPLPEGRPVSVCLSTGRSVEVLVTAAGDTLIGRARASIEELRPALSWAGVYASIDRMEEPGRVVVANQAYARTQETRSLPCERIRRVEVGTGGLPIFAPIGVEQAPEVYVPIALDRWRIYRPR